jgi:hypothetical protein
MMRILQVAGLFVACVAALSVAAVYGASYYYTSQHGQGCASCHEMAAYTNAVHASAHRTTTCLDCHDARLSTKLRHIRVHLSGHSPEAIHLRDVDVVAMTTMCKKCHQHEYASWHAGPHSATYAQIFTDPTHNAKRRLADDCLRCHGMHFNGAIRELVQPMNTSGPWHLVRASIANQPAMPCMACHEMHREGPIQSKPAQRISTSAAPVPATLAFLRPTRATSLCGRSTLVAAAFRWIAGGEGQSRSAAGHLLPVPCAAAAGGGQRCGGEGLGFTVWVRR